MLGAIIGDIVGSRFEWNNIKTKEFDFLTYKCFPTDDSIMTLALAQAILVSKADYSDLSKNAVECMQAVGRNYPDCGYGQPRRGKDARKEDHRGDAQSSGRAQRC